MVMEPQSPKTPQIQGQISQKTSFQDVIDNNADRWVKLDPVKKREVADAFFDDQVIPANAEKWGTLDPVKQTETRRAFYQDFGIEPEADLRFDAMSPLERFGADLQAKTQGLANQFPVAADLMQAPNSYFGGQLEGVSAQGFNYKPAYRQGPISSLAQNVGNTVGGIGGRIGLSYGLAPFLGPGAAPAALGLYGGAENINYQADEYGRKVNDLNYAEAGTSAAINALSGLVPGSVAGKPITRALSGAALNLPFGIADMASQDMFEGRQVDLTNPKYLQQLTTDAGAGAILSAMFGKRGGMARRSSQGSPISLRQLQDLPPAPEGTLQGRVEAGPPLSEGWKFKPTKDERQFMKRVDPTRKGRYEKTVNNRSQELLRRAENKASQNPVSYEQMIDDLAKEVLDSEKIRRKALIAQHKKMAGRYAKRTVRNPQAIPTEGERFSLDLSEAIDREIERRKVEGKAKKSIAEAKERTAKEEAKAADKQRADELKTLKEDIQQRSKEQVAEQKTQEQAQGSVKAARIKQAVTEIAPDKTKKAQRDKELKELREDIQSRNNPLNVPLTEKSYKYVKGSDGNKDLTVITPEIAKATGMESLAVRLQYGYHKPKAQSNRGEGFGLVHIEAGHGAEIREQGFKDAREFVEYVLKNKNEIYTQPGGRYVFVVRNGRSKYAIVELQKTDDGFYGVTTAFPEKPQYIQDGVKGRKLVWSGRNSQSQVGQPRSAEPATVSKTSDQVGYGARAKTSNSKNSTPKNTIKPPERKIPQARHEGDPQVPDNPGKQSLVRQKTSGYATLQELLEDEDAYNAYREMPKEHQKGIDIIEDQMKRGERLEIFGYDPKTGVLTSGTGRKEGLGGDPNKLVTPIGWHYNHNTREVKLIAYNNNFQLRQYIIPKESGAFGANAVLANKQKGLVGTENNVYYKPGSFADPSEYVDQAVKKLPISDIAAIFESGGAVPPQTEARLRNLLNVKGDGRVEVYNHVREIMSNKDAFKKYVYDNYLKGTPLVAQLEKGALKSTDAAKAGALATRLDSKIRKITQLTTGCE